MKKIIKTDDIQVENMIYEIRGKQVMLDSDLAKLYECANGTKTINLAVKRHINRFPERFMFQLTKKDYDSLRFQLETTNNMSRTLPYVFTEQGVAMLATVIRTKVAEQVSIRIMDAFVTMRHYYNDNLLNQRYINNLVLEDHSKIKALESLFEKLESKQKINEIYFNGQIYDAYSKILDIFNNASRSLIIVDAYADNKILDIVKRLSVKTTIITHNNKLLTKQDVNIYNQQYHNLNVIYDDTFHDRYFVIDGNIIYHCGTSINRIGYKTFSINLINDKSACNLLISKIKEHLL